MRAASKGRPCRNQLTSECFQIEAPWLLGQGAFRENFKTWCVLHRDGAAARLRTRCSGQRLEVELDLGPNLFGERTVALAIGFRWLACPYGGSRPYLLCPGAGCGRSVDILYGVEDFLCRRCRRVTYPIQRIAPDLRSLARAQILRQKLGGSPDITKPIPPRPKGMHEWTYTKKGIAILAAERKANERVLKMFAHMPSRKTKAPQETDLQELFSEEQALNLANDLETQQQSVCPSEVPQETAPEPVRTEEQIVTAPTEITAPEGARTRPSLQTKRFVRSSPLKRGALYGFAPPRNNPRFPSLALPWREPY